MPSSFTLTYAVHDAGWPLALACAKGQGDAPGVVIVSHDEELLESACDRIVEVRGKKLHHYVGAEPARLRYIGPSANFIWVALLCSLYTILPHLLPNLGGIVGLVSHIDH